MTAFKKWSKMRNDHSQMRTENQIGSRQTTTYHFLLTTTKDRKNHKANIDHPENLKVVGTINRNFTSIGFGR